MYSIIVTTIILIVIPLFSPLYAIEIRGSVSSVDTGAPIVDAHVELEGAGRGDVTTDDGAYRISNLVPGKYTLSASCVGYKVDKVKVVLYEEDVDVDFTLVPTVIRGQEVIYNARRAVAGKSPVAYSDVSGQQLREDYWAQDIPPLLQSLPGVYAYSEMGEGMGYTHINIRGFDTKRLGVTINNIPLNDPEDGFVYWVDTPDLVANVADIQVQRGVGVTSHGTGAFGGSVNLVTASPAHSEPDFETHFGGGSFNSRKWGLSYNSGMIENKYGFYGRFSQIQTDGYRDNSGIQMYSYFLTGSRYWENNVLTLNLYGGKENTHAAWYASAESAIKLNRKDNPYTYPNTIDDFSQPRYELHHELSFNRNLNLTNTLYYVRGVGYYEQYKYDADLVDYGYQPFGTTSSTDLIKQDWVKKNHVGYAPLLVWDHHRGTLTTGGDLQWFESDHYGQVVWGRDLPPTAEPLDKYYDYAGKINTGGFFAREQYQWNPRLTLTGDIGLRFRWYHLQQDEVANFQGAEVNSFKVDNLFIDPKIGANYQLSESTTIFGLVGISHRPPADFEYWDTWYNAGDFGQDPLFANSTSITRNGSVVGTRWSDPTVDPEQVLDVELGTGYVKDAVVLKANVYWMSLQNEIIAQGGLDPNRGIAQDNADRSTHMGLELESAYRPDSGVNAWANLSISSNTLEEYKIYDWADDGSTVEVDLSGNQIALFPSLMLNAGLGYDLSIVNIAFDLRHIGKQYLDNYENEDRTVDAYSLLGLSMSMPLNKLSVGDAELKLRVNNLLDKEYETSGYYDPWSGENYYFVGAERNWFLTLTMNL